MGRVLDKNEIIKIASEHLQTEHCSIVQESNAYCVVQRDDTTGFVIISLCGSHKTQIIGYSDESVWDTTNIPFVLLNWLTQLDRCSDTNQTVSSSKKIYNADLQQKKSVLPLLTCHWHQDSPYNDLSPLIADVNVKTAAGCVAIAAAQIAYYWRKDNPEYTLKDTPVYPYGKAPITMSIPKGAPNNWDLMRDSYTKDDSPESKYAVAQLCYVIGTSSYLNYATSTGGYINDASNAIYGQYNLISDYTKKSKYTQNEWEELIYNELMNARPILCSGDGNGGHAFVLDGYDHKSGMFHINFGWGGYGDGYYLIDDSEVAMGGYNQNQSIVYNIHPKNRNIDAVLNFQYSGIDDVDIVIDITNRSTLGIKCLKLYLVPNGYSLDDIKKPIWELYDTIDSDGQERKIVISDIDISNEENGIFYLVDDNEYVIGRLPMSSLTGIKNPQKSDSVHPRIFNLNGQEVKSYTNGMYIIDNGKKRTKVIKRR